MTDADTERETIESLLATSDVYITVTERQPTLMASLRSAGTAISPAITLLERWYRCTIRCTTKSSCSRGRRS